MNANSVEYVVPLRRGSECSRIQQKKKKILFKQFHFVKPLPANATAKMQYIYKSQLEVAKWRAASEYDEYMTKKFEEDLRVSFHK